MLFSTTLSDRSFSFLSESAIFRISDVYFMLLRLSLLIINSGGSPIYLKFISLYLNKSGKKTSKQKNY